MSAPVGNTCPKIDDIINCLDCDTVDDITNSLVEMIDSENVDLNLIKDLIDDLRIAVNDDRFNREIASSTMEDIRSDNSELRSWGYEQEERADELENDLEKVNNHLDDTESQLELVNSENHDLKCENEELRNITCV